MKTSFKTTTLIAAIGMIVYTIYIIMLFAIHKFYPSPYHYDLWKDIQERLIVDILQVSFIIAGLGLLKYRPSDTASKSFRIFTVCLFVALVGTLLSSPLYCHRFLGMMYLFPSIYWRAIMLISSIVWLFMLMRQPLEEASPRSYRVTLIAAMIILALPIVLEMISGFSLALGGEIFCFNSYAIKSWVRWIAPTIVLVHFVFPQIKDINRTKNSHLLPGTYKKKSYNLIRIVSLLMVGLTLLNFILFTYYDFLESRCWGETCDELVHKGYFVMASLTLYISLIFMVISWIMLSIMAFRYLPNPRGYKIYNIACQVLTWGSLLITFFVPYGIDEISISIFLISFCVFFVTTSIRVISYSLIK